MFPLLSAHDDNPVELFQIWLNLSAVDKMVEPHFTMFWAEDIPSFRHLDAAGRGTTVTVIAGTHEVDGQVLVPPSPPPASWASRREADLAIWHIGGDQCATNTGAVVDRGAVLEVVAGAEGAEVLMMQARPIGEPVAQYGPFVMNTREEIEQAFDDYRRTGFGGWPWDRPDPVHGADPARFARHADGRLERPPTVSRV